MRERTPSRAAVAVIDGFTVSPDAAGQILDQPDAPVAGSAAFRGARRVPVSWVERAKVDGWTQTHRRRSF